MLAELFVYQARHSQFADFLAEHASTHFKMIAEHLPLFGAFTAASGERSRLIHLAAYEDYESRQAGLAGLEANAALKSFSRGPGKALARLTTTLLNPTSFSPIRHVRDMHQAVALRASERSQMLFELRTYTAIPGKTPSALRMLAEEGNPLTHQFVEWPAAYFMAETGRANRIMMLWAYSSAAERARRKAQMLPDPRFQELGARFNPHFCNQQSDLWTPTQFSPIH